MPSPKFQFAEITVWLVLNWKVVFWLTHALFNWIDGVKKKDWLNVGKPVSHVFPNKSTAFKLKLAPEPSWLGFSIALNLSKYICCTNTYYYTVKRVKYYLSYYIIF